MPKISSCGNAKQNINGKWHKTSQISDEERIFNEQQAQERENARRFLEQFEQEEQELRSQRDPELDIIEQNFEVDYANDTYSRYIWGTQKQVSAQLVNGLELKPHDNLPKGWFSTHVGGEEWVAMLAKDYDRSGPVCKVEIFDLPLDQYWITDDPDLTIGGKLYSAMIISKNQFIPPQCLEITAQLDTEEIRKQYPEFDDDMYWQMA